MPIRASRWPSRAVTRLDVAQKKRTLRFFVGFGSFSWRSCCVPFLFCRAVCVLFRRLLPPGRCHDELQSGQTDDVAAVARIPRTRSPRSPRSASAAAAPPTTATPAPASAASTPAAAAAAAAAPPEASGAGAGVVRQEAHSILQSRVGPISTHNSVKLG